MAAAFASRNAGSFHQLHWFWEPLDTFWATGRDATMEKTDPACSGGAAPIIPERLHYSAPCLQKTAIEFYQTFHRKWEIAAMIRLRFFKIFKQISGCFPRRASASCSTPSWKTDKFSGGLEVVSQWSAPRSQSRVSGKKIQPKPSRTQFCRKWLNGLINKDENINRNSNETCS